MTSRLILLTLAAALMFVACPTTPQPEPAPPPPQTGPPAPPTPPTPQPGDTTTPTIISVSPDDAAIGVAANAKISIEFSEPMNQTLTEGAFQSADMPSVTFAWSANGSKLEIDPVGDLEHTALGRVYSFNIRNFATDLAGNSLLQLTSTFRTLRELTRTFESVAALDGIVRGDGATNTNSAAIFVGDLAGTNTQLKGYLSFDLVSLEVDGLTIPERITNAEIRVFQHNVVVGSPYTNLKLNGKRLLAAHVAYGATLNSNDFNAAILHDLGEISSDFAVGYKTRDNALDSVRDDWAQRVARENRSQFTLFFPLATNGDGLSDFTAFNTSDNPTDPPELEVTFLVP